MIGFAIFAFLVSPVSALFGTQETFDIEGITPKLRDGTCFTTLEYGGFWGLFGKFTYYAKIANNNERDPSFTVGIDPHDRQKV